MKSRALAALLALLLVACSGASLSRRDDVDEDDAVIYLACEVADAAVWIDDRQIGLIVDVRGGIALGAGSHRLELRHDAYHSHYAELTLAAREERTLTIELAPLLP